jgi:aldose 1-epimerase
VSSATSSWVGWASAHRTHLYSCTSFSTVGIKGVGGGGLPDWPCTAAAGWDDPINYCAYPKGVGHEHTYFGATIGRIANRIAGGKFTLGGTTYHTPMNDHNVATLHGGWVGWDRRVWDILKQSPSSVTFSYTSPDGESGFPGTVR